MIFVVYISFVLDCYFKVLIVCVFVVWVDLVIKLCWNDCYVYIGVIEFSMDF